LSTEAIHRAFRAILRLKMRRRLPVSNANAKAYEAYFASVRESIVLRWLFSRMRLPFPASFEEHALAITAQLFTKHGVAKFYLPLEWEGEPLSAEKHLREPSIFLSRHGRFALGTLAITELGGDVVTIAARPESQGGRIERSGIGDPGRVTILPRNSTALLNLRAQMARGRHACCFADWLDPATGRAMIHEGLFTFARMSGAPVHFLRFTVNARGRVLGAIDGPVDCADVAAAIERFVAFTGARPEISRR